MTGNKTARVGEAIHAKSLTDKQRHDYRVLERYVALSVQHKIILHSPWKMTTASSTAVYYVLNTEMSDVHSIIISNVQNAHKSQEKHKRLYVPRMSAE